MERNQDTNVQVQLTSYLDSIPKFILKVLAVDGRDPVNNVDDIKGAHLKECVDENVEIDPEKYGLDVIKQ